MTNTTRTGRGLDVNALANATAKVTLGFKCEAQLKMDLAIEADRYSMGLSEYVEVLVVRRHENHSENENRGEIERLKNAWVCMRMKRFRNSFKNTRVSPPISRYEC